MPPLTPFANYRFKDNMTREQNNYTKQAPDTGKQKVTATVPALCKGSERFQGRQTHFLLGAAGVVLEALDGFL